ncbi:hypothetical protein BA724_02850 [Domibacillus iocasae]|uniref:Uncharacterized protein n=1 Tax=Domibacillus iocasae TaxID=1714016 RepID=A0A1E7DRQ6_9BACI|nr:hypothetical protein BA724_02850 [Domibacillus iocasae]
MSEITFNVKREILFVCCFVRKEKAGTLYTFLLFIVLNERGLEPSLFQRGTFKREKTKSLVKINLWISVAFQ